jgi:hypothetical protein
LKLLPAKVVDVQNKRKSADDKVHRENLAKTVDEAVQKIRNAADEISGVRLFYFLDTTFELTNYL